MIAALEDHRDAIAQLCRRYGVRRLDVFGSAASEDGYDPSRSDLDLLVEFGPHVNMGPADQYFGLLEELQSLLRSNIDLVSVRGLRNPYFIESVNRTRQVLYAS
jgi:uncharacterized protein